MKIIELENEVKEIRKCSDCPCVNYDGSFNTFTCNLLSNNYIDIEINFDGILENCPLKKRKG